MVLFFFLQRRHHKIKNESIKHTKNVTNKILIFKFKLRYIWKILKTMWVLDDGRCNLNLKIVGSYNYIFISIFSYFSTSG